MKISLIAALPRNRVIGRDNELPWHLPADLKFFKNTTMGRPIIMGRKTYDSIGRPLPGRHNIIVTRNRDYACKGCTVTHSLHEAVQACGPKDAPVIIGGASLYQEAIALVDCMYLTFIDAEFDGDTLFPQFDRTDWIEVERENHKPDTRNPYHYSFVTLERKPPGAAEEEPLATAQQKD